MSQMVLSKPLLSQFELHGVGVVSHINNKALGKLIRRDADRTEPRENKCEDSYARKRGGILKATCSKLKFGGIKPFMWKWCERVGCKRCNNAPLLHALGSRPSPNVRRRSGSSTTAKVLPLHTEPWIADVTH